MPEESDSFATSIRDRCRDGPLAGPATELLDLFGTGGRKRNRGLQGLQKMICVDFLLAGKSGIECGLDGSVNFCAQVKATMPQTLVVCLDPTAVRFSSVR